MTYFKNEIMFVFNGGKYKKVRVYFPNGKEKFYKSLSCLGVIEALKNDEDVSSLFQEEVWNYIRW